MNRRKNEYLKTWLEAKDSKINFIVNYMDLVLSVIIEIFPQGNYVCRYRFYEGKNEVHADMLRKEDIQTLLVHYSIKIDIMRSELINATPEVSILSIFTLYRKTLVTLLGKFWVLNISTIYIQRAIYRANSLLLPYGKTLNIIDSKTLSNDILTQIHSLNLRIIQKLRYERFRYLIKVVNRGIYVLRYMILISGVIPFSSLLSLDLFYFNNPWIMITSFIILGFTLTILVVVPLILTKNFESKIISYLNYK